MKRILSIILSLVILATALAAPVSAVRISDFQDVPETAWYREELEYATEHGLIQGMTPTKFGGSIYMTRAMFVTILGRAFGEEVTPGTKFTDVDNSQYYAPYVYWGAEHDIIRGRSETLFAPNRNLTRQEMAVIMARAAKQLGVELNVVNQSPSSYADRDKIASWAKDSVEYCWKYGLMQGDAKGFRPADGVRRAEGMAVIVRFARNTKADAGALQVIGTQLSDSQRNPVQLKGVSTHGLAWFPDYVNEACFRQLRDDWNVNVVRLAMYTAEYGGYCTGGDQKQLKALIDKGVGYATELGMYVIIDWHILSDGNPNRYRTQAKEFFTEMSQKYADHTNVLYEICNEPNGGTSWSEIKDYAEEIIPAIRRNDSDAVILVGTPNWSQYVDQAAADPIQGYDNIMYTLHFYADTHRDSLRSTMAAAIRKGLPVFVSEYGICDASGNGSVNQTEADKWVSLMNQYGVSYVNWSLCNKAESASILRSSCNRVSGFGSEDLSTAGVWLYEMLTGKRAEFDPSDPGGGAEEPGVSPGETVVLDQQGGLACTAQLQNQWESNGTYFYQYTLTLKNTTESPCTAWTISLPFSEEIALDGQWNGVYSVSGSTLTVSSVEYNGAIAAGGTVGDIGFIVKGGAGLRLMES